MLRLEAGRNPHDPELTKLVGELSMQSELFRERWASRDVKYHRSGVQAAASPCGGRRRAELRVDGAAQRAGARLERLHGAREFGLRGRPQAPGILGCDARAGVRRPGHRGDDALSGQRPTAAMPASS